MRNHVKTCENVRNHAKSYEKAKKPQKIVQNLRKSYKNIENQRKGFQRGFRDLQGGLLEQPRPGVVRPTFGDRDKANPYVSKFRWEAGRGDILRPPRLRPAGQVSAGQVRQNHANSSKNIKKHRKSYKIHRKSYKNNKKHRKSLKSQKINTKSYKIMLNPFNSFKQC